MAKIPRVPVENQITTLSVVKIAIKFSPCTMSQTMATVILNFRENLEFKNNCTYMKYLVLLKKHLNDFRKFRFFYSFLFK